MKVEKASQYLRTSNICAFTPLLLWGKEAKALCNSEGKWRGLYMKAVVGMSDWEGKGYRPIRGPAVGLLLNRWMNIKCLGLLLRFQAPSTGSIYHSTWFSFSFLHTQIRISVRSFLIWGLTLKSYFFSKISGFFFHKLKQAFIKAGVSWYLKHRDTYIYTYFLSFPVQILKLPVKVPVIMNEILTGQQRI